MGRASMVTGTYLTHGFILGTNVTWWAELQCLNHVQLVTKSFSDVFFCLQVDGPITGGAYKRGGL